ncbi:hypothetical protein FJY63_09000 [Candidatus Sumerlaeota bacterium]|nr:hypothetical protein [Candidatus Sumerlaeota bacterium]
MPTITTRPEKEFKVGAVRAAIWANPRVASDGRSFNSHKVILERVYKDREGFKSTDSLDPNDIPKAILALKKAYEYLMCVDQARDGGGKDEVVTAWASPRMP